MHPMIANLYGTQEKLASAQVAAEPQPSAEDMEFSALVFDAMEKQASAEGLDLSTLSEEDLAAVYNEYATAIGAQINESHEKTAAFAEAAAQLGVDPAAMQEADTLGRVMYHAYVSEAMSADPEEMEKQAAEEELAAFDELALHRAQATLNALNGDPDEFVKTATLDIEDEEIDDLLDERAGELLMDAGYDLDDLASALDSDA